MSKVLQGLGLVAAGLAWGIYMFWFQRSRGSMDYAMLAGLIGLGIERTYKALTGPKD